MSAGSPPAHSERLVSLDVFRGMTIAGMILVNNPGTWSHIYAPLRHADWHGWTFTDLIFPFFLFIVGVAMAISFPRRVAQGDTRSGMLLHTLRRSAILFALGLFLSGFPFFDLSTLRIPGVLQRIALCYFFAAVAVIYARRSAQVALVASLLLGYWALMTWVPVPGFGAGNLDSEGNLAAYCDRALLQGHLWKPTWDPEGALSTLPAIATTLLGVFAGVWLGSAAQPENKTFRLALAGAAGMAAGTLWGLWFPINKNLWTSSYVLFTGGMAAVVLAACYWVIDVRGWRRWAQPFVVYGMNAIAVFVASGLIARLLGVLRVTMPDGRSVAWKTWIFEQMFAPLASPINASLLFALAYVLSWLGVMWLLSWRRIFIKI